MSLNDKAVEVARLRQQEANEAERRKQDEQRAVEQKLREREQWHRAVYIPVCVEIWCEVVGVAPSLVDYEIGETQYIPRTEGGGSVNDRQSFYGEADRWESRVTWCLEGHSYSAWITGGHDRVENDRAAERAFHDEIDLKPPASGPRRLSSLVRVAIEVRVPPGEVKWMAADSVEEIGKALLLERSYTG